MRLERNPHLNHLEVKSTCLHRRRERGDLSDKLEIDSCSLTGTVAPFLSQGKRRHENIFSKNMRRKEFIVSFLRKNWEEQVMETGKFWCARVMSTGSIYIGCAFSLRNASKIWLWKMNLCGGFLFFHAFVTHCLRNQHLRITNTMNSSFRIDLAIMAGARTHCKLFGLSYRESRTYTRPTWRIGPCPTPARPHVFSRNWSSFLFCVKKINF